MVTNNAANAQNAQYNLIVGTGSAYTNIAPSATSGVPLISQGAASNPAYGTAVVAGGGTGVTSNTAYAVLCGGTTGTGAIQSVASVGSSGQVLTSNGAGALPTFQSLPTQSLPTWTLANAGGTALTGAATITVSGLSNVNSIMVIVEAASSASAQSAIGIRLNTDTGNNYYRFGSQIIAVNPYSTATITNSQSGATDFVRLIGMSTNAGSTGSGTFFVTGCNTSGVKIFQSQGGANASTGTDQVINIYGGYYNSASVITSVSVFSNVGNFDAGTVYVYTSP
jgi:hypothetical protein